MNSKRPLFIGTLLLLQLLTGCTGVLESTVEPRAALTATPTEIQQGEEVTFDARASDAIEGVITEYSWDFGDGTEATTITGFTSHQFLKSGQFNVRLTVTNDQGGTDSTTVLVRVNGAPQINLSIPEVVRSGDIIQLDASNTVDPEGGPMKFVWDLNYLEDSDGDGDTRNDIDSTEPQTLLMTNTSGLYTGSLTIDDGQGGIVTEVFEINVSARQFNIEWKERVLEQTWSEYLDEGEEWTEEILPGQQGRILSFEAVLELENDIVQPYDNFSLVVSIPGDGFNEEAETEGGNVTQSENAKATIIATDLNPKGLDEIIEADSEEMVLRAILDRRGQNFGQNPWALFVHAIQTNPDSVVEFLPDPDPGNDWTLTLRIVIHEPVITEIAFE